MLQQRNNNIIKLALKGKPFQKIEWEGVCYLVAYKHSKHEIF